MNFFAAHCDNIADRDQRLLTADALDQKMFVGDIFEKYVLSLFSFMFEKIANEKTENIFVRMDRKSQPKKKLASDLRKASITTYTESYIRMLFSGAKKIKRKDRKAYYEQIPETVRKRFLETYPTWEKDVFTDDTKERLASYAKIFIKNVPVEERARFYKNLDEDMKKDFLNDYPDWKDDI